MITPKQATETLGVSSSTLRRWASEFEPFLDPRKGVKRLYSVSDLATFGRIKDLYQGGLNTDQVKQALPVAERAQDRPGDQALITLSDFARSLEMTQALAASLQSQIDAQGLIIQDLRNEIETLKAPWFKRVFSAKRS
jgi:DNA-binding transcriptional MerR regulator